MILLIKFYYLKKDFEWYIRQQIYPPVLRLCAPIEGTNEYILADHLGTIKKNRFAII
jgi:DNA polymerase elongation subunit (family B)